MSLINLAVLVLAIGLAFNLLLTFALIARLQRLQRGVRIIEKEQMPVGYEVPPFSVLTVSGELLTEASLGHASAVVGFFLVDCKACETLRGELGRARLPGPLTSIVVGDPSDPETSAIAEQLRRFGPVACADVDEPVVRAFGAKAYPVLYRVERGIVRAAGNELADVLA
jgi:hypothetical protein